MSQTMPEECDRHPSRREFLKHLSVGGFIAATLPKGSAAGESHTNGGRDDPTVIAQVRLRGKAGLWNVGLRDGRIDQITKGPIAGPNVVFGDGNLLTEGLVEHHIHLDKVLTRERYKWDEASLEVERQNWQEDYADGKLVRGFTVWRENQVRSTYTEEDVYNRALQVTKTESANGTTTIRTHCVVDAVRDLKSLRALLRLRDTVRPFMDLQINLHPQDGLLLRDAGEADLIRRGMELGADGIGGIPEVEPERTDEYIDLVFRLAKEHDGFVDIHADQRPDITFSPPIMVAKTRKYGLQGRVTVSHGFSLAFQPPEKTLPLFEEMKKEGVALACGPTSRLQERVQVPRSKGVLVSLITDNVADPWNRSARADLVEAAAKYTGRMRIRSDEGLESAFDMVSTCPAQALGLDQHGVREGGRADLILRDAESVAHAVADEATRALVFKNGRVVAQSGRALW